MIDGRKRGGGDVRADGLPAGEAGGTSGPPHAPKKKRTISLSPRASALLDTQAFGMGLDVSELVERLVIANCCDYEVKFRGEKVRQTPGRAG